MSVAEWRAHMMAVYAKNRQSNPTASLRDAMIEAKASWREHKATMGAARQGIVANMRERAAVEPSPALRKTLTKRANVLEIYNAANALRGMRDDK
jgi:hypothetical protein